MSHSHPSHSKITRRTLLAGTAAGVAATGLGFGLSSSASAAMTPQMADPALAASNKLCAAHHHELASHLTGIVNSSYVDTRMKNKVLSTTTCPHCKVHITPDRMNQVGVGAR